MSSFPGSPRILKGGLVLLDPSSGLPVNVIPLQYNPDSLSRSMQVQGMGENADRSEALRLKGPAVETIKLEAELDLTDLLEVADPTAVAYGLNPQLAALEAMIQPTSATLQSNNNLASIGTLEIIPAESPLVVFVWGRSRVTPVRVTEFSVTEEAFDTELNPIRAKVSLGLRVLNINDVGFDDRAGVLFMSYLRERERMARLAPSGALGSLGIEAVL
jgi:hypothetical protein